MKERFYTYAYDESDALFLMHQHGQKCLSCFIHNATEILIHVSTNFNHIKGTNLSVVSFHHHLENLSLPHLLFILFSLLPSSMRCHLATAITVRTDPPRNPLRAVVKAVTRPFSDGLHLGEHLVAGAIAAAMAVTAVHPMDTVKTVVQSSSKGAPTNSMAAFASTVQSGGLPALYKGLMGSLSGQVPAGAIKFAAFETFTQFASSLSPKKSTGPAVDFVCAALAFVCCSVVFVPGELMKQRLQSGMYPNLGAGVRKIISNEGFSALYTGYSATLLRDIPYTMFEFGLYTQFKKIIRVAMKKETLSSQQEVMLGGLAGGCTGFLTNPLDLAKTRLMTQASLAAGNRYSGVLDVLVKVAKAEGPAGLFRGAPARVMWLIPFTAVYFGAHEASKRALLDFKSEKATAKKAKAS